MSKSIVTTQAALTPAEVSAAQAVNSQEIVTSDVLIPRLLLMQGISPLVTSRKAQIGDMVRSTTGEKLGNPEKPLDLVPLTMVNTWINFEDAGGQPKFRGQEHRGVVARDEKGNPTQTNEDLPWEYKGPNGESMFRRKAITLYALLPSDVAGYEAEVKAALESGEAPDLSKTVMPIVLTFQSTSFKHAGKKVASFFNEVRVMSARLAGKATIAPFQYKLTLSCREEKKGTNAWYVFDVIAKNALVDKKAKPEEQALQAQVRAEAANWAKILSSSQLKVDDSGEVAESVPSSSAGEVEV